MKFCHFRIRGRSQNGQEAENRDIAARTGLSPSTVSRVLAGKRIPVHALANRCWPARVSWAYGWHGSRSYVAEQPDYFRAARAFDQRSDIFYYRVIQSISKRYRRMKCGCVTARWRSLTATRAISLAYE